jgi:XisH protein
MARDLIHFVVKHALEKEGWKVTHDPFPIKIGGFDMEIDLGAEIIFAAEKDSEKIARDEK